VQASEIALQIEGRTLILAGYRGPASSVGEVYQQVEIERGAFRRQIDLGAEIHPDQATAQYQDGMLRVELPLIQRGPYSRAVPIESRESP
jgi:HSP20 family molecular chaperone IbpA